MTTDKILVDASIAAVLIYGAESMDCLTLQEAKLAYDKLPQDQKLIAKIISDGKTYSTDEIERLHYLK